jgi:peptide chain release factor
LRTTRLWRRKTSLTLSDREKFSCSVAMLCKILELRIPIRFFSSVNKKIDFSKVPKLDEKDLEENFVRGDGPGGQATAKTNNCVVLKHKPTNFVVKNHESRSLDQNRKAARELMIAKLDEFYNKEESVENQRKRLERAKTNKAESKAAKLRERKMEFKRSLEENSEENKS